MRESRAKVNRDIDTENEHTMIPIFMPCCFRHFLSFQTNFPRDPHTPEKDLPPICEHLIQSNPVSLAQERSALVNTRVFTVNTGTSHLPY